ncbi:MAG: hypothetical protein AAFU54_08820 [Chloroflexota bacterium]
MDNENIEVSQSSLGLLDLSVELSSPEIYSGEEFTVYLKIKNPFDKPIWIKEVSVSLPSKMYWNRDERPQLTLVDQTVKGGTELAKSVSKNLEEMEVHLRVPLPVVGVINVPLFNRRIAELDKYRKRLVELATNIDTLESQITEIQLQEHEDVDKKIKDKKIELRKQQTLFDTETQLFYAYLGYDQLVIRDETVVSYVNTSSSRPMYMQLEGSATIQNLVTEPPEERDNRAELKGSLPIGAGLQQGNTDVWTIRLGTIGGLLFIPAQYNLQFNVIYGFTSDILNDDLQNETNLFVNTTSKSLSIRTSMIALIVGAFLGGIAGAIARELQIGNTRWQDVIIKAGLSGILSLAAVIFAARKADTQAFISVEDFWGGAVVGFVIGFSGTAAFQDITGQAATVAP